MNKLPTNPDRSVERDAQNSKEDEGILERLGKTLVPPSRKVSDAELMDPGANAPAPKPLTPAERAEAEQRRKNK